jgi:GNAT superfamily N-acetyltransferase
MGTSIREVGKGELEELVPLLLLAEPSASALRWSLAHLSDAAYRMDEGGELVAAATMRWRGETCEIVELGVAGGRQGQGLGRRFVEWLIAEATRRGKTAVTVGTGNSSIGNIVFYQKCGFRMDHVRQDYFWYHGERIYENGILLRDMLVFRYDLTGEQGSAEHG